MHHNIEKNRGKEFGFCCNFYNIFNWEIELLWIRDNDSLSAIFEEEILLDEDGIITDPQELKVNKTPDPTLKIEGELNDPNDDKNKKKKNKPVEQPVKYEDL